jgi:hypothetical protein
LALSGTSENVAEMLPRINRALATGQVAPFLTVVTTLLLGRGDQLRATEADMQEVTYA